MHGVSSSSPNGGENTASHSARFQSEVCPASLSPPAFPTLFLARRTPCLIYVCGAEVSMGRFSVSKPTTSLGRESVVG
jgi:hypothetical protein